METVCFYFGHKKKREGEKKELQVDQNAFEALHNIFKPPRMDAEQITVFKWYFYQTIFSLEGPDMCVSNVSHFWIWKFPAKSMREMTIDGSN